MNRRKFVETSTDVAATPAANQSIGTEALAYRNANASPNVLIIYTDQQSCWTLGAYGGTLVPTPNIDSLAKEGAIFSDFFANSAVCTPSRGCFLTGRYPHVHGAVRNNVELNRDEETLARVLREHGYETGYAGKWHLDGPLRPGWMKPERAMGFADCRFMFNRGHWKQIVEQSEGDPKLDGMGDEKTYTTDWLTDKTIEFLQKSRSRPFFYMVGIPDPHSPFTVRAPYDTMFAPEDMPIPTTFDQEELPEWAREARLRYLIPHGKTSAERGAWLRRQKAQYCGEVKCIDDNVGRMLACLREIGMLDDTIVVFTTDHGEYMGEHGLMYKNQLYETAHRIPMLVRWPARIARGTVIANIVSTVDFQQTILGLMGIEPCGREQGRDASPLLRGQPMDWEDEAHIHHSSLDRAGIFTSEFELAYVKDSDAILFDRRNDPDQAKNLFHDPAYRAAVDELTDRIIEHNVAVEAPAAEWLKGLRA